MNEFHILLIPLIFFSGCASNPRVDDLTSEQRANFSKVEILSDAPTTPFDKLGVVKGISCHRNAYQANRVTSDEAINGVKLQAVKLNADAVINMVCQESTEADWSNNCWSSYVCIGDAIRYK